MFFPGGNCPEPRDTQSHPHMGQVTQSTVAPVFIPRKVDSMNDTHKYKKGLAFYLESLGVRHTLTPDEFDGQRQLASKYIKTYLSSDGLPDRSRCLSYAYQALERNELDVTWIESLNSKMGLQQIVRWRKAMGEELASHSVLMQIQERDGRFKIHYHAARPGNQIKSFLCYEDNLESRNPLLHLLVYPALQAIRADARRLLANTAGRKLHDGVADQQVKDQTVTETQADHLLWEQFIQSSTILSEYGLVYRENAQIIDPQYLRTELKSSIRVQIVKLTHKLAQTIQSQETHPSRSRSTERNYPYSNQRSRSVSPGTAPGLPSTPLTGHRSSARSPKK